MLVVGILDGREEDGELSSQSVGDEEIVPSAKDPESLRRIVNDLRADFSGAILHQLLIFDLANGQIALPDDVIAIPSPEKSRTTTVKTVMCDMTSPPSGGIDNMGEECSERAESRDAQDLKCSVSR